MMRALGSAGFAFVVAYGLASIIRDATRVTVTGLNRRQARNARILREREERRNGVVMPVLGEQNNGGR